MAIDLWRTRPYVNMNAPLRQWVDRVFDDAFARETPASNGSAGFQTLPVNVWESGEGYQAALLAPGLDQETLNVTVHDDTLVIEGELRFSVPEGAKAIWQEFGPSKFRRSLRLGTAVDPSKVEAVYTTGCCWSPCRKLRARGHARFGCRLPATARRATATPTAATTK